MEKEIIEAFDFLTVEQTEKMLCRSQDNNQDKHRSISPEMSLDKIPEMSLDKSQDTVDMRISTAARKRIQQAVYRKTGVKNPRPIYWPKKLIACTAAAAVTLLLTFSIVGFDNVAEAFNKLFGLIPGYGIVENGDNIEYILAQPVSAENEDVVLTLSNAVATRDGITVMIVLKEKNFDEQRFIEEKQAEWEVLEKGGSLPTPDDIILHTATGQMTAPYGEYGSVDSTGYTLFKLSYHLKAREIGTDKTYTLECPKYNLSIDFQLTGYATYQTLEEIGTTGYNNNISITAVPTFRENKLQVDLYPLNKSGYELESFYDTHSDTHSGQPYQNQTLRLETNSGTKPIAIPEEGSMGMESRFLFDIESADKDFTLRIPYIIVQTHEEKTVTLTIPQEGTPVQVNQRIEFADCTMTIVTVEKIRSQADGAYDLKMTVKYDNKSADKVMRHPSRIQRVNIFGMEGSGGWGLEPDENGLYTKIYFELEENEKGNMRLKFSQPSYYLTGEYVLSFSRSGD